MIYISLISHHQPFQVAITAVTLSLITIVALSYWMDQEER